MKEIKIEKPPVSLRIGKQKIELTHEECEQLFEALRVHLGKQLYTPWSPSYSNGGMVLTSTSSGLGDYIKINIDGEKK